MRTRPYLALPLLFLFACIAAAQSTTRNITYTTDAAGAQRGDLYGPAGAGPFPAIVFLHGGAWRSGDKSSFKRLGNDLAAAGYAGFSIDYDLRPGSFPLPWTEGRAAVAFLRAHAAEYRIDPAHIVIAGTSAGGEIAALMALTPDGPAGADDRTAVPVSGAIILNGVFDLCFSGHVIERYLGGPCDAAHKAEYTDASPARQVRRNAPPFFIGHGTSDHVVPYAAAEFFAVSLRADDIPVTTYVATGGPHMYWEKSAYYDANLKAMEAFLQGLFPSASTRTSH